MAKYRIMQTVKAASGIQTYLVDAQTPEDAAEKHNRGESRFEGEEIEVKELHPVDLRDVELA